MSLPDYIALKGLQIIFVIAQHTVICWVLLLIVLRLYNMSVPTRRQFIFVLIIALLYELPIYLTEFLLWYPYRFDVVTYSALVFMVPVLWLVHYYNARRILKLTPTKSIIMLRSYTIIYYAMILTYMLFNHYYTRLFGEDIVFLGLFGSDLFGMITVISILTITYNIAKFKLNKKNPYITIPPNYFQKNETVGALREYAVILIFYLAVVFMRTTFIPGNMEPLNATIAIFYLIMIFSLIAYLYSSVISIRAKLLMWEMESTSAYMLSLIHANNEFRKIKHDFYNILQAYEGFIEVGSIEKLKSYHNSLFTTTKKAGRLLTLIEELKSRPAIYNVILEKLSRAEDNNIDVSLGSICDITNIVLTDFELARIMGIVLDNAIEASLESDSKIINISFEMKDEKTIVFAASNSTLDAVDETVIFQEGYTTKKDHMGIGLPTVRRILNSYDHCSIRTNYFQNQFLLLMFLNTDNK